MNAHPARLLLGELAAAVRAAAGEGDAVGRRAALPLGDWATAVRAAAREGDAVGRRDGSGEHGSALESEKMRGLPSDQLAIVYREQWFRMLVPRRYGGLALALPEAVRLEEAISWADGSLGWTVTLCSGAGWFAGFLPVDVFGDLLADEQLCMAGSGAPTGEADFMTGTPPGSAPGTGMDLVPGAGVGPGSGAYIINGYWERASGALHATAFTANCVIKENGVVLRDDKGEPLVRVFLFLKEEVTLHHSWHTIGLIATGSHAFSVRDLAVPPERCFEIAVSTATVDDPLYHYPFLPLAETTLAVNLSGMAIHFLDCCEAIFPDRIAAKKLSPRNAGEMMRVLGEVREDFYKIREDFYAALDESWRCCVEGCAGAGAAGVGVGVGAEAEVRVGVGVGVDGIGMPPAILDRVSRCSHALAVCARQSVDRLYPYCGLSAADPDTEINRVWRDIHTASQHSLLVF